MSVIASDDDDTVSVIASDDDDTVSVIASDDDDTVSVIAIALFGATTEDLRKCVFAGTFC